MIKNTIRYPSVLDYYKDSNQIYLFIYIINGNSDIHRIYIYIYYTDGQELDIENIDI